MDYVERRGIVELRLLRDGLGLNRSALARELGVSRKTVLRDVYAVIRRWQATGVDAIGLEGEWLQAAVYYGAIARHALEEYARLKAQGDGGSAAVGYLNAGMRAMALRTKLLGLDEFEAHEPVEQKLVIAYRDARLAGPIPFAGRMEKPDMYRDADGDLRVVPEEGPPEGAELVTREELEREELERQAAEGEDGGSALGRYVDWVE